MSAVLARAWSARYWKPLQTGAADGDDDTGTVATLAGLPPERVHAPVRCTATRPPRNAPRRWKENA